MRETTPSLGAGEALLDRPDQPRSAIRRHEERIAKTPPLEVLEERTAALGVLLGAGRQMQQHLLALAGDPPGAQHGLSPLAAVEPLRDAIREQVCDLILR